MQLTRGPTKILFSQIKNDKWAQIVLGCWFVAILTAKSLKQRKYRILTDAKEISTFRPALNTLKAKTHRYSHKTWLERSQVEYYKICKTGKSFLKNRRNRHIHLSIVSITLSNLKEPREDKRPLPDKRANIILYPLLKVVTLINNFDWT